MLEWEGSGSFPEGTDTRATSHQRPEAALMHLVTTEEKRQLLRKTQTELFRSPYLA